jgi:hypothetical protein
MCARLDANSRKRVAFAYDQIKGAVAAIGKSAMIAPHEEVGSHEVLASISNRAALYKVRTVRRQHP